jgi:hypothetical protein
MMNSKPTHINSEQDNDRESNEIASASVEEVVLSLEQVVSTATETQETQETRIELPQPDAENITVLTDKLPNKPILPWNRYDSPWEGSESESQENTEEISEETALENATETETADTQTAETESDEVD